MTHTDIPTDTHVCLPTYFIHSCMSVYIYLHFYMETCMHALVHLATYTYTHIHTTYIHIHVCMLPSKHVHAYNIYVCKH